MQTSGRYRLPARPGRKGLALLVVVGVLGVMAVLTVCFLTMARMERKASDRRVNATRALLLARSGMEDVLARLNAGQDPLDAVSRYAGEDWDNNGTLNLDEPANEVFGRGNLDRETCPVAQAMRPSFFVRNGATPSLLDVDGRRRGLSGRLTPASAKTALTYATKVEDESGKINVNGGFLDTGNRDASFGDAIPDFRDPWIQATAAQDLGRGWNGQLVRILNLLGSQTEVGIATLGTKVLASRPLGGYRSVRQLQALIGTAKDLSPWLTTRSWVDRKVVRPNTPAGAASQNAVSDLKMLRPALKLDETGRPPVNLNAAARPVLLSLVQDLSGTYFFFNDPASYPAIPYTISPPTAVSVVTQILARRQVRLFSDWGDFGAACDVMVPTAITGMNPGAQGGRNLCGADLLKANFDPNTKLNKESPDQLMWRWIDKSDLTVWSTEGCFHPTGVFRISCQGRVTDLAGRVLAQAEAVSSVEAFRLLRQTTQKDFVASRTLTPPAGEPRYLSLAPAVMGDPALPLQGYGATASALWWGGTPPPTGQGLAAMTYPCPVTALPGNAAEFDGSIALATVEMRTVHPASGTLKFLQHFDDSWNAETVSGGTPAQRLFGGTGPDGKLQNDLTASVWPDPALPLPARQPNTLLPDGMSQQSSRSPCYQARTNIPGTQAGEVTPSTHGALGYWIKSFQPFRQIEFCCVRTKFTGDTQAIVTGRRLMGFPYGEQFGMLVESAAVLSDAPNPSPLPPFMERQHKAWRQDDPQLPPLTSHKLLLPGGRWEMVTGAWDSDRLDPSQDVLYRLDALRPTTSQDNVAPTYPPYTLTVSEELLPDTSAYLAMGEVRSMTLLQTSARHGAVLDEFAICDFGDDDSTAVPAEPFQRALRWKDLRWRAGRYYKEGNAAFTSAVLSPLAGRKAVLLRARWTQYLPNEPRKEIRSNAQFSPDPPSSGQDRLIDPRLNGTGDLAPRLDLELLDATGPLPAVLQPLTQGAAIGRTLDAFRYRVTFRVTPVNPANGAADILNQPVLETPVLDDITFEWQSDAGPRILGWGE